MEFEEFENILKQIITEFKLINTMGFIGMSGSFDMKRDLDLIIAPNKEIKKGVFLKSLIEFLEELKRKLKKSNSNLIVIPYSYFEEETKFLSGGVAGKDIFLHVSSFPDLDLTNIKLVKNYIKNAGVYYGNEESMFNIKKTDTDYYYNYLFIANCLFSNYPKKLEENKIRERISYIFKYNNKKLKTDGKSNKEIFLECCDFLDSIAKWKN